MTVEEQRVVRRAYLFRTVKQIEITLGLVRRRRGLSQLALARRIGSSQSAVSEWENGGGMSVDSLLRLADALGYDVALIPHATKREPL